MSNDVLQPRYLVFGPDADGAAIDPKAQAIASSEIPEKEQREALLRLVLDDPRIATELHFLNEDEDRNRALHTLERKILAGPLSRYPLDVSRIADGDSFSGWAHKVFKLIAADARRKGTIKRRREISLEEFLDKEEKVGEISLGIAVRDAYNPYSSITMRRPMGKSYTRAERAVKNTDGSLQERLDAGIAALKAEHWVISDETDAVDERLILSLLLPRLSREEHLRLDALLDGLGTQIAYADRGNGLGKLWSVLDTVGSQSGIPSMTLWERITHLLFAMRWHSDD